jgi:hypothetical protein
VKHTALQDWTNADKVGTRFPPSKFQCPDCHHLLLEDNWPPNYGGGSAGGSSWTTSYSQKCVCLPCKTAVRVSVRESSNAPKTIEFSERVPLVQHTDGTWLTPHDVRREQIKAELGEYPTESYG